MDNEEVDTPKQKSQRRGPWRDAIYLIVIALLIALCGQFYYTYHYKPQAARSIKVYYNHETPLNEEVTNGGHDDDGLYNLVY